MDGLSDGSEKVVWSQVLEQCAVFTWCLLRVHSCQPIMDHSTFRSCGWLVTIGKY